MATLTKLTTNINLEMSGDTKRYLVSAKQGDKATRFIIARLLNNGEPYTIPTGARAVINIAKPDGKHVYNTCSYSGSDVTVELTNQALVIVGLIAVCAAGGYAVYVFVKMPSDKQLNKVREWLLYAVTKAEKELGGGTGQIKLRYVYDMFVARFTWLARVISFEAFSMMVDEALERMKKMLESNKAMQTLVSGEAGETVEKDM